ncbi:MAG TPA: MATE family efflux transporter [Aggregatilineales bacterium]|nr:MATE family efflux transporter [Aggregatilineales bacterium]
MSHFNRLGTEKVGKLLLEMSSQTTFSLLVYAIYSITDTYFLSVGVNSLAAAGASIISPVLIALGGITTTVGAGGASVVSRALGENNPEKASRTIANTFMIFWAAATTLTIFGAIFIEPIVYLFGATESVAPYAIEYGRIIFLGALTSTGYSAIVRADGNIRYSTAMWLIPVSTNIVLSWLFVMIFHLGAGGAAIATIFSQGISACMGIYFFFFRKNRSYHIKKSYFEPDWSIIGEVILIGFPSFIKSFSASMVVIITNNLLNAMGGDSALSVFAIVNRLYLGMNTPQTGIVQGMQPIVGYNFGQKKFDRVRKTITYSLGSSLTYGLFIGGLCLFSPMTLVGLLTTETTIIAEGQIALRLMAFACPVGGISLMIAAYFQSIGRAKEALLITLGGIILIKLPVLFLASNLFSLTGIWASEAISEFILCITSLLMLRHYQRKFATPAPIAYSP